ncbi:hypothetical protein [Bradyrhizobium sp. CCBAU 25338]|uniref:hypothetical protein n=1 Tax=Bradyrhizobium sp. CCBAU 25338 TaxID=1641877 RepID=UPI002302642F|nr:hypothetical protein [Bradyrhizobium sp. CCBAU 25338]MDA9529244.1 hypothetical protein [Bradyrhizobium sp. CCBAU 25338]
MADMSDDQLERSLFPDGCQPGRCVTIGGDAHNTAFEDLMAALDALDDCEAPPAIDAPTEETSEKAPQEPSHDEMVLAANHYAMSRGGVSGDVPSPLAKFRAILAADARRKLEQRLAAKKAHQRKLTADRVRKYRAAKRAIPLDQALKELEATPDQKPLPGRSSRQYKARLNALITATANPCGDKFLISIRPRVVELTDSWVVQQCARKRFGAKASDAKVARMHPDKSMTKRRAESHRNIIAKLEQPGRPWAQFATPEAH